MRPPDAAARWQRARGRISDRIGTTEAREEGLALLWCVAKVTALMPVSKDFITRKRLSVQEASQRLTRVVLGLLGHAGIRRAIEAVIRPRIDVELDRHARATQSIRIS